MPGLVQGILTAVGGRQYATWSTTNKSSNITLSGGNLVFSGASGVNGSGAATIGKSSGKWYWEITLGTKSNQTPIVGIINFLPASSNVQSLGTNGAGASYAYRGSPGCYTTNGIITGSGCTAQSATQVISIALDCDAHTVKFYVNGTLQVTVSSIAATTWYPACGSDAASGVGTANFGSSTFTYYTSSGAQAAGYNQGVYN